jgi:hypothetical protein
MYLEREKTLKYCDELIDSSKDLERRANRMRKAAELLEREHDKFAIKLSAKPSDLKLSNRVKYLKLLSSICEEANVAIIMEASSNNEVAARILKSIKEKVSTLNGIR